MATSANMRLELGNNLDILKTLSDNSVDSIVTDPPYGLSFMNKKWDYDVPSTELWMECLRVLKPGGHLLSFSSSRTYHRMAVRIEDAGFEIRDQIMWVYGSGFPKSKSYLKPAHEPICLARKPGPIQLLNIDDCRIGELEKGRYPANIIFDEIAGQLLDQQTGTLKSGKMKATHTRHTDGSPNGIYGKFNLEHPLSETYGDEGGASRFFYCAKASKKDKGEGNTHITVKPTTLMEYLIKLITPVNGIVMDPFMGSGSTGKAAAINGYDFIGMELEEEYYNIAKARINYGN